MNLRLAVPAILLAFLSILLLGNGYGAFPQTSGKVLTGYVQDDVRVVRVTAGKGRLHPDQVVVRQGENIRLEISSPGQIRQFSIDGYPVDVTISAGATATVDFLADRPGEFAIHCSSFTGGGYASGSLVVLPTEP